MYVGIERDSPLPVHELFSVTGNVSWERLTANVIHVPVQDVVGKLGFVSAVGWLAFRAEDGMTLVQQFTPEPDAVYPDGGARAEIWLQYRIASNNFCLFDDFSSTQCNQVIHHIIGTFSLVAPLSFCTSCRIRQLFSRILLSPSAPRRLYYLQAERTLACFAEKLNFLHEGQ